VQGNRISRKNTYSSGVCADYLRSLAIDHLLDSLMIKPVYIYFYLQERQNQTAIKVVASLLKQLVLSLDHIPQEVTLTYEQSQQRGRPDFDGMIKLFQGCAKEFSSVVVILDAFDECDEDETTRVLEMVGACLKSQIKVYITTRSHLLENVKSNVEQPFCLEIEAKNEDIEMFLTRQLDNKKVTDSKLRDDIVKAIILKAQGMY